MLGAAPNLAERGLLVDAEIGRQIADILPAVEELGRQRTVPGIVVVHLGTNGSLGEQELESFFQALERVPRVIVLNVHADRDYVTRNNERIAALSERFDNVEVIDWNTLATEYFGSCLAGDGIHLSNTGKAWYARLVFDQINYGPDGGPAAGWSGTVATPP